MGDLASPLKKSKAEEQAVEQVAEPIEEVTNVDLMAQLELFQFEHTLMWHHQTAILGSSARELRRISMTQCQDYLALL